MFCFRWLLFFSFLSLWIWIPVKSVATVVSRPNFVIILMDDQDIMLDSPSYMPNLQSMIVAKGKTFNNAFVATPVCCPSRTEFISGRYYHNIGAPTGNCMFINATGNVFNANSIFSQLHAVGYKTGIFGKLTNADGNYFCKDPHNMEAGGLSRVYSMCEQGDFYDTRYFNYSENAFSEYTNLSYADPGTYQGAQIGNASLAWMETQLEAQSNSHSNSNSNSSFVAYLGYHEPHIQYTPAAWFANAFEGVRAPRTPNFNQQAEHQMPWLNAQPALNATNIQDIDRIYQDRLASTLQIDVVIPEVIQLLQRYGQLNNTFILYFSDHGYHLGQWRLPCEKYQMFDTDIRIPFYMRGPGIAAGSFANAIVGNVDVMPTLLDLAGIPIPDSVDGKSFKAQLLFDSDNRAAGMDMGMEMDDIDNAWRDTFLIEFLSPFQQYFNICSTWYPVSNDFHGVDVRPNAYTDDNELVWVNFGLHQNPGNNYREIRIINATHDWAYTEYLNYTFTDADKENPYLHVLYNVADDKWEMNNIYAQQSAHIQQELHQMLMQYGSCQGSSCP